jgi:fructose/tagatose bisphosphate aldolase
MTDLSPAAQAVLDAAVAVNDLVCTDSIAAALRAAAEQASPEKQVADIDYVHQNYLDGIKDTLAVIQEIADELDGSLQLHVETQP